MFLAPEVVIFGVGFTDPYILSVNRGISTFRDLCRWHAVLYLGYFLEFLHM